MADYAVGDIHGHRAELEMLLEAVRFDPAADRLWCVGDLVNRGPDSIGVLRLLRSMGDAVRSVLGNHDLYLLASARPSSRPIADEIAARPEDAGLLDWLAGLPLSVEGQVEGSPSRWLMTHAGVHPQWSLRQTHRLAAAVQAAVRQGGAASLDADLETMPDWRTLADEPAELQPSVLSAACHCLTRMRQLSPQAAGHPGGDTRAWFDYPLRVLDEDEDTELLFGHWARLHGKTDRPRVHALDTGCCWGGKLTAMRLQDRRRFGVECLQ